MQLDEYTYYIVSKNKCLNVYPGKLYEVQTHTQTFYMLLFP